MKANLLLSVVIAGLAAAGCGKRATTIEIDPETLQQAAAPKDKPAVREVVVVDKSAAAPADITQAFPENAEGKLLIEQLKPREIGVPTRHSRANPLSVAPPRRVVQPEPPLPPSRSELPRGALARADKPVRPQLLPGDPPLAREQIKPALPEKIFLIAGPPVRLRSEDVERMQPLPFLSDRPAADRASSADPTANFSKARALTTKAPARAEPAPFLRIDLPDPFRDRIEVRLLVPPMDSSSPSSPIGRRP